MAILIILTWVSGYVCSGPVATSLEFSSMERCEGAAAALRREAKEWSVSEDRLHAFCTAK